MFRHKLFQVLIGLIALLLASCAAYVSIIGLTKVYAGTAIFGLIMFGAIEVAKIGGVSYVQRYWKFFNLWQKLVYPILIFGIMIITSWGVYGFLMDAYQSTSSSLNSISSRIEIIKNKKTYLVNEISNIDEQIDFRNKRINSQSELRSQQEVRLDTLYQRKDWKSYSQAKDVEKSIQDANNNIELLNNEISIYNGKISLLSDSIGKYDIEIIELNNNDFSSDLGPLIYVANLTGKSTDEIINIPTLIIIIILDPMAIALLIAFNNIGLIIVSLREKEKKKKTEPVKEVETQPTKEVMDVEVKDIIKKDIKEYKKPKLIEIDDISKDKEVDEFINMDSSVDLIDIYDNLCKTPSNINEHLPTLKKYALSCDHITELRTDSPDSIFALLSGKPKKLVSYDKIFHPNIQNAQEISKLENIDFTFIQKSLIESDIKDFEQTDLLFIDVGYDYQQLIRKLSILEEKVNKFIIIHDTETTEIHKAIIDFTNINKHWLIDMVYKNNNGLIILKWIQ